MTLPKILLTRISVLTAMGFLAQSSFAQDNSPYSRYGLGDITPPSNINTRGMGGISAGYADVVSINYNNPASYSQFQVFTEARSKRVSSARAVLDIGINNSNRTLIAPNTPNRFTSSDLLFSYINVGLPLRKNWGLSFGLRPVTRVSYLIQQREMLKDSRTGLPIDSSLTQFEGRGGSYLPSIGTGFGFDIGRDTSGLVKSTSTLSFGANLGYLFGKKEITTRRTLFHDSTYYYPASFVNSASYGSIFWTGGVQYQVAFTDNTVKEDPVSTVFRLGLSGNLSTEIKGSRDITRQTFYSGSANELVTLDSVYSQSNVSGAVVYPSSYRAGFTFQRSHAKGQGFLVGLDYSTTKWSEFRYFGERDSVRNNWQISVGTQLTPRLQDNYFSRVAYRFGFYAGPDYIQVRDKLASFGVSVGFGLPIPNFSRLTVNQFSMVNLAFEYGKRGNNDNLLKENMFRLSIGLNLTDLWFMRRQYE